MARAMVRFLFPFGKGGQGRQRCVYVIYFYGDDVPDGIDGQPFDLEVFMAPAWNIRRLNAAILDAVTGKAAALGLTVSDTDIFDASFKTRRSLVPISALRSFSIQKDMGNVTTVAVVGVTGSPVITGTPAANNNASGQYIQYTSMAVPGSGAGWQFGTGALFRQNLPRQILVFYTPADLTNYRLWVGLFGGPVANVDTQAFAVAGFRFSTPAVDPGLMRVTNDGAAQTTEDTGVAFAPLTRYEVEVDASVAGEVSFYINGIYCGTITTTLPGLTAPIGPMIQAFTQVAGSRAISISHMGGESL